MFDSLFQWHVAFIPRIVTPYIQSLIYFPWISVTSWYLTSIIAYSIMQKWPKYYKETHPKELMWNSKNTSFEKFNKDIKLWYFLSLHYFSFYFYIIFYYSFLYSIISTLYSCIFSLFSTFSSSSHSYWC